MATTIKTGARYPTRPLPQAPQQPEQLPDQPPPDMEWPPEEEVQPPEAEVCRTIADEQRERSEEIQAMGVQNWIDAHDQRNPENQQQQVAGVIAPY
jgi:hypothetical protein